MMPFNLIPYFIFTWLAAGAVGLFVAEWGPFNFLPPASLIFLIEELKLFFILIILPLLPLRSDNKRLDRVIWNGLLNYGLFVLLFLPLTISGAILAESKISALLLEHLFFLFAWLIIVAVKHKNLLSWYYLAVFTLSGALPLVYYLIAELVGPFVPALLYFNPFWLVYRILL